VLAKNLLKGLKPPNW